MGYKYNPFTGQMDRTSPSYDIEQGLIIRDHFITSALTSSYGWTTSASGGTAAILVSNTAQEDGHPGIINIASGTTATGRAALTLGPDTFKFGSGIWTLKVRFKLDTISDGTETYVNRIGFGDTPTADNADGAYFETSNTNWFRCTAAASSRTKTDTGVACSAGWHNGKIVVTPTAVTYYMDGVSLGTNTTNIPTNAVGLVFGIFKSVGTTSRFLYIDAVQVEMAYS